MAGRKGLHSVHRVCAKIAEKMMQMRTCGVKVVCAGSVYGTGLGWCVLAFGEHLRGHLGRNGERAQKSRKTS